MKHTTLSTAAQTFLGLGIDIIIPMPYDDCSGTETTEH